MVVILNKKELDKWLFDTCQDGDVAEGIKGEVDGDIMNVAWRNTRTGETFDVEYEVSEYNLQ